MKRIIAVVLTIAMLLTLAACGGQAPETIPQTEPVTTEQPIPEETKEETGETEEMITVTFDFNYEGAPAAQTIELAPGSTILPFDGETPNTAPETPVREGYRFAGWDTLPNPTLENGTSTTEWPLNDYYLVWYVDVGPAMGVEEERMELNADTTLYARWVEKTVVNTAEELQAMREDLSGWYELGCDIDLSETKWVPVGTYVSHYEYLNPTWWAESFRGEFDGAGHTISGLRLDTVSFYEDHNDSRKEIRNGVAAMFGAVGEGAVIRNVTLDHPVIEIESDIHYAYVAPLAGMVEGGSFTDCHVTNMEYTAVISDAANEGETATDGLYVSASGLICGVWAGTVENCTVEGTMNVSLSSERSHTGNVFVGGVLGDGYIPLTNCSAQLDISCVYADHVAESFTMDEDMGNAMKIMCGGTTGLAAAVIMSPSSGSITIENHSEAGNALIMCEGSYGMILTDPESGCVASDFTGTIAK